MQFSVSKAKEQALRVKMERLGIRERDIEEKFIRSSGKGGQKVNKASTCVYLKHKPSGIEVKCQQERSQALNRFLARRILARKIETRILGRLSEERKRIEKIRRQKRRRSKRAKEKMLKDMVEKVKKTGANVVICQKGIDDLPQHYLAKAGIYAVRRAKKSVEDGSQRGGDAVFEHGVAPGGGARLAQRRGLRAGQVKADRAGAPVERVDVLRQRIPAAVESGVGAVARLEQLGLVVENDF